MLRAFRRVLRSIDYYSARRERTIWTRLSDLALFAAPLLAIALALLLHRVGARGATSSSIVGYLVQAPTGDPTILLEGATRLEYQIVVGDFDLTAEERRFGLPLPSRLEVDPPTVSVRMLARGLAVPPELRTRVEASLADAVRASGQRAPAEALRTGATASETNVLALAGNMLIWCAALAILLPLLIQGARLVAWMGSERRRMRRLRLRRRGLCPHCGFDVRASVWSSNCPECGALLE